MSYIFLKNFQFASLHFDFDHPLIHNRGLFSFLFFLFIENMFVCFFPLIFHFNMSTTYLHLSVYDVNKFNSKKVNIYRSQY